MSQVDKNISQNLKRIRKSRNMSLDMLAEYTGVSKSMLGQIERGESNPTVTTIAKIVEGLKVPFEDLLYSKEPPFQLVKPEEYDIYKEKENSYIVKAILPYDKRRKFELYEAEIKEECSYHSLPHGEGIWEYITVTEGVLNVEMEEETFVIDKGNTARFPADRNHTYFNRGKVPVKYQIILSCEEGR